MNREILRIALPSIVTNITVPLLALVDTAIVGHLGAAAYIGAIALGGMVFNMIYWLFGFLRMGTGGLTAQAYGAGDEVEMRCVLLRSLSVAAGVSFLLVLLQWPLIEVVFRFVTATPEVESLARLYFSLLIWGAPAVLGLYSFTGWFLGMQNAKVPMWIAIVQNVVNIVVSLTLVLGFRWKVEGVATGTLVAQYVGLAMACFLWRRGYGRKGRGGEYALRAVRERVFQRQAFSRFFSVNRDIFLRTLCLIAVSTYFTSAGSAQGEGILAANALLMQYYFLFSYVMDGFAYAGESLGGRYYGAGERQLFSRLTRRLFVWGMVLAAGFTLIYIMCGQTFLALLTDDPQTRATACRYLPFAVAVPLVSVAAFLFDGLFIGTTSMRLMLVSMAVAVGAFFFLTAILPPSNAMLWAAWLVYLGGRGAMQGGLWRKLMRKFPVRGVNNT